jgi:hypothetical protein
MDVVVERRRKGPAKEVDRNMEVEIRTRLLL